jgi:hypothetical protein
MKFRLIESYTDYGYMNGDIEVASDNSDEFPEEKKPVVSAEQDSSGEYKNYEVTIRNKPSERLWARSPRDAARICRIMYDNIDILGVKEI